MEVIVTQTDSVLDCPLGWTNWSSSCYRHINTSHSWPAALATCSALGECLGDSSPLMRKCLISNPIGLWDGAIHCPNIRFLDTSTSPCPILLLCILSIIILISLFIRNVLLFLGKFAENGNFMKFCGNSYHDKMLLGFSVCIINVIQNYLSGHLGSNC